jgi:hypothetical protein
MPLNRLTPALLLAVALASPRDARAQLFGNTKLDITTSPNSAVIFRVRPQDNTLVQIGVGAAQFELRKDDPNTVVIRLEGFRDLERTFPRDGDYKGAKRQYFLPLTDRIVAITALPYDARILVNGEIKGQRQVQVDVPEGGSTTVELRAPGFAPVKRVYEWPKGSTNYPPANERLELRDRRINVSVAPAGTEVFVGETRLGADQADVVVPQGTCVRVKAVKEGWAPVERQYCHKEETPAPPQADRIPLTARIVMVNAPADARVYANGKLVGTGPVPVRLPEDGCVSVLVQRPAYMPWSQQYCNGSATPDASVIPISETVEMNADESWAASEASVQANVNIGIEVGEKLTEEKAWKLVSAIVLSHFDVLENSDRETGYLRTAWRTKSFEQGSVIRTRMIVIRVGDSPLRYGVKIVSERLKDRVIVSDRQQMSTEDENFEPWPRLLNTYKDIISEMQSRLK